MADNKGRLSELIKTPLTAGGKSARALELGTLTNGAMKPKEKIAVNFAGPRVLATVPGIGVKFATKIINMRSTIGNLTPDMLVACLGAKADVAMLGSLSFEENKELIENEGVVLQDRLEDKTDLPEELEVRMREMMTDLVKEFVTPGKARPGTRKGGRAPRFALPLEDDLEAEEGEEFVRAPARKRAPRGLPKNLSYDGKSNWAAFKQKFERYADAYEWTEEECLNCLCWSLVGKAADFYATITERMETLSYRILLKKLEKRFGARELAETTQAQFQQAVQTENESLEDWADRVLTLATRAFRELPEKYANQQAVVRFCQGLNDKSAAQDASIKRHQTMEEAMDHVKWFQHVHQAVYGKPKIARRHRELEEEPAKVYEARKGAPEMETVQPVTTEIVEQLVERLGEKLMQKLSSTPREKKRPNQAGSCYQCGQKGHFKRDCPGLTCFNCQETGHLRRDCPKAPALNGSGSSQKPEPRPRK